MPTPTIAGDRPERSAAHSPHTLPSGPERVIYALDRSCTRSRQQPSAVITQSQSRRLKMTYKLVQTIPIRAIANG